VGKNKAQGQESGAQELQRTKGLAKGLSAVCGDLQGNCKNAEGRALRLDVTDPKGGRVERMLKALIKSLEN
jgi:hypothetical protein